MTKNLVLAAVLSLMAASSTACFDFEHTSTLGPTTTGVGGLAGTWSSSNLVPSPSTCTDFQWNVTDQTETSAGGAFTATCAGELKLNGTARGILSGSTITWTAQGNAAAPGLSSCAIALTGTAELTSNSIRVPYSGDTCLGKVSGVENLQRR